MRTSIVALFFLAILSKIFAQTGPLPGSPNYRLYPGNTDQTEVFIINSPLDQNILFSACNTLTFIPFFISEGIYATEDGGQSWQGSDTCKGDPIAFHGGDPGITIDFTGRFILTRMGRSPFVGLYSHYSDDNGRTWSVQKAISTDDLERASLKTGISPLNPYPGRTYAVWVRFAAPFPVMVAHTDDGAATWSPQRQINNPSRRCAGGDVAIGPDGQIYVCWAGVTETSPFMEIIAGFASSNNSGESWTVAEEAFPMMGINGVLANKENIRVNGLPRIAADVSGGPRNGWIYIVSGERGLAPAGSDPDIVLHRSSDGGATWSEGIRVNQDALNSGKTQYFPAIHVDRTGAVNILFYDDRNTTADSSGVFLARSLDGGDTWTEREISDHRFKPVPIGGLGQGYQGDNIDLTSTDTHLWPVWMDNSTGVYQVWTAPLSFSDLNAIDGNGPEMSSQTTLRLSPNPTAGRVRLTFNTFDINDLKIIIYNSSGSEVGKLTVEMTSQRACNLNLDTFDLKPGLYLVRVESGNQSWSEKVVLLN